MGLGEGYKIPNSKSCTVSLPCTWGKLQVWEQPGLALKGKRVIVARSCAVIGHHSSFLHKQCRELSEWQCEQIPRCSLCSYNTTVSKWTIWGAGSLEMSLRKATPPSCCDSCSQHSESGFSLRNPLASTKSRMIQPSCLSVQRMLSAATVMSSFMVCGSRTVWEVWRGQWLGR